MILYIIHKKLYKPPYILDEYTFAVKPGGNDNKGQVVVTHYGVEGRICSRDWDDADAHVMCRSMNYQNGMAYYHDELATISSLRGPYWLSGFNCTGDEASLLECPNNTRLNLGNCSSSHIASVLCFNDTGESGESFFFFFIPSRLGYLCFCIF